MIDPSIKDHSIVALKILRERDHHLADHIHLYIQALERHYSDTIQRACHHEDIAKHHENLSRSHHMRCIELERQLQDLQKHVPTEHFAPVTLERGGVGGRHSEKVSQIAANSGGDTTPILGTSGGEILEAIRVAEEKKAANLLAAKPWWKFWA